MLPNFFLRKSLVALVIPTYDSSSSSWRRLDEQFVRFSAKTTSSFRTCRRATISAQNTQGSRGNGARAKDSVFDKERIFGTPLQKKRSTDLICNLARDLCIYTARMHCETLYRNKMMCLRCFIFAAIPRNSFSVRAYTFRNPVQPINLIVPRTFQDSSLPTQKGATHIKIGTFGKKRGIPTLLLLPLEKPESIIVVTFL